MESGSPKPAVPRLDAAIELLGRGGTRGILAVAGESMRPTLRSGQRVVVDFGHRRLERGDLVLYRQQDYLVIHRLLGPATREDGWPVLRTRGDGVPALDPPLERRRVRGRVVAAEAEDGWWDFDGGGARAYALTAALHDLAWAAASVLAAHVDRALGRIGVPLGLAPRVAVADRRLFAAAHHLAFRVAHRRRPGPETAGSRCYTAPP